MAQQRPTSGFATDFSTTLDKDLEKDVENDTGLHHFNAMHRSSTAKSTRTTGGTRRPADIDGAELVNLPSRTLGDDANLGEYLEETISGVIPAVGADGKVEDFELVTWTVDDKENPKNWSTAFKWYVSRRAPMVHILTPDKGTALCA